MHLPNPRVPAFSLVEMLVVLVLSSIIIGIIYFAYYSISTYQITLSRKYSHLNDMSTLYFTLKKDIARSQQITALSASDLYCAAPQQEIDVYYTFAADYIIRKQATRIDTFKAQFSKPIFRWQAKALETIDNQRPIDEIQLEVNDTQQPFKLNISKQYDAASLIELTPNDTLRERN